MSQWEEISQVKELYFLSIMLPYKSEELGKEQEDAFQIPARRISRKKSQLLSRTLYGR